MINLVPWRNEQKKRAKRITLSLLILPSILFSLLHASYIGSSYLSLGLDNQVPPQEKQQLTELRARVEQEKEAFSRYIQDKQHLLRLKESLSAFTNSNPLLVLPSTLPRGIFIYRLSCQDSSCHLVGQALSFDNLNSFIQQLKQTTGIDEVKLELSNDDKKSMFELVLTLSTEDAYALAIR